MGVVRFVLMADHIHQQEHAAGPQAPGNLAEDFALFFCGQVMQGESRKAFEKWHASPQPRSQTEMPVPPKRAARCLPTSAKISR